MSSVSKTKSNIPKLKTPQPKVSSSSLQALILNKCHKIYKQLADGYRQGNPVKNNNKYFSIIAFSLEKDIKILSQTQDQYASILSMVYNAYGTIYKELGEYQKSLHYIDEALKIEGEWGVSDIEKSRTLLNKSIILIEMSLNQKEEKKERQINDTSKSSIFNLYSHEQALKLVRICLHHLNNESLSLFKIVNFTTKQNKSLFCQVLIFNLYVLARQLIVFRNRSQGYALYQRAYNFSMKMLGQRHFLTVLLNDMIKEVEEKRRLKKRNLKRLVTSTGFSESQAPNKKFRNTKSLKNKKNGNYTKIEEHKDYVEFNKSYSLTKLNQPSKLPKINENALDLIKQGRSLHKQRPQYWLPHSKSTHTQETAIKPNTNKFIQQILKLQSLKKKNMITQSKPPKQQVKSEEQSDCQLI